MRGYPVHLHEVINKDLQESIYDETFEGEVIRDSQYSLEVMECLYCGKEIPEEQAKEIKEIGVEPYCDYYCFGMDNYGCPVG